MKVKSHMSETTNRRRPRIALWFRYGPGDHAQLFSALPDLLRRLAEKADVHYFGLRGAPAAGGVIPPGVTVHELPFSVRRADGRDKWIKTLLWLALLPWLGLRCRRMGIELIFMDETLPLSTRLARVFYRGHVITMVADFFLTIYGETQPWLRLPARWINALDLRAWRRLPLLFTKTETARRYLIERGAAPEKVVVTYNPCDLERYRPRDRAEARRRFGFDPTDYVAVHHGILHPNKGNDFLLRSLAPILREQPRVKLLLIGDGPEMPILRRLARELDVESQIRLTGWLPALEDVSWGLNAADVGLVMRRGQFSDHFHVTDTLAHNLACGLPVLAARLGGMEEIVGGADVGELFDPTDADDLRDKFTALMNDPARRARQAAAARRRAETCFARDDIARRTAAALLNLLSEDVSAFYCGDDHPSTNRAAELPPSVGWNPCSSGAPSPENVKSTSKMKLDETARPER